MITDAVIKEIYSTYRRRPSSPDKLNISYLGNGVSEMHGIEIVDGKMIIASMELTSPFRRIPMKVIHAIENFENDVAIVLHSSIIFLSKKEPTSRVHIKLKKPSIWQRMLRKLKILQ